MSKSDTVKKSSNDVMLNGSLSEVTANIVKNIEEGNLVVVNVGDKDKQPSSADLTKVTEHMSKAFENIRGIKVLVLPYNITVNKIPLPQLRMVLNEVIVGPTENVKEYDPIIGIDISDI